MLNKEAKRRRKTGEDSNIYGPNELRGYIPSRKELWVIWTVSLTVLSSMYLLILF